MIESRVAQLVVGRADQLEQALYVVLGPELQVEWKRSRKGCADDGRAGGARPATRQSSPHPYALPSGGAIELRFTAEEAHGKAQASLLCNCLPGGSELVEPIAQGEEDDGEDGAEEQQKGKVGHGVSLVEKHEKTLA